MRQSNIVIIDYKIGNHQSVFNALKFLGCNCIVSNSVLEIKEADGFVLPGVGAFAEGIKNLNEFNLVSLLSKEILVQKKPILGICLGMQLFAEESYEYGRHLGLGWIPGKNIQIKETQDFRVPHVGWNNLNLKQECPLFERTEVDTSFYFDHSYHFSCPGKYVAATCDYSSEIVAAVQRDNIYGVQFHPEKSQTAGLKVLRCFLNVVSEKVKD